MSDVVNLYQLNVRLTDGTVVRAGEQIRVKGGVSEGAIAATQHVLQALEEQNWIYLPGSAHAVRTEAVVDVWASHQGSAPEQPENEDA